MGQKSLGVGAQRVPQEHYLYRMRQEGTEGGRLSGQLAVRSYDIQITVSKGLGSSSGYGD